MKSGCKPMPKTKDEIHQWVFEREAERQNERHLTDDEWKRRSGKDLIDAARKAASLR